jgi:hypothetical protein
MKLLPNPHPQGCPWHESAENFGVPNLKWCEETLCSWISEPANTWSNLAYFIAAIVIYRWTRKSDQVSMRYLPYAMFLMGLGSYIYHMSNNYFSQIIDFVGMYIYIYWLAILNMMRLGWVKTMKSALGYYLAFIVVNTIALHLMYLAGIKFQLLVLIAGIFIVFLEFLLKDKKTKETNYNYLKAALLLLVVAESFSLMDLNRIICFPTNHWFQGHAIWHLISATGLTIGVKHWAQFKYIK